MPYRIRNVNHCSSASCRFSMSIRNKGRQYTDPICQSVFSTSWRFGVQGAVHYQKFEVRQRYYSEDRLNICMRSKWLSNQPTPPHWLCFCHAHETFSFEALSIKSEFEPPTTIVSKYSRVPSSLKWSAYILTLIKQKTHGVCVEKIYVALERFDL